LINATSMSADVLTAGILLPARSHDARPLHTHSGRKDVDHAAVSE
jgi:hypothetical protein